MEPIQKFDNLKKKNSTQNKIGSRKLEEFHDFICLPSQQQQKKTHTKSEIG